MKSAISRKLSYALVPLVLVSTLVGCSSIPFPRTLQLERSWVRSTLKNEHLAYRRMNRMSPILVNQQIIEGNGVDGLVSFQRETGREQWRILVKNGVEGGATVAGDKIYFGAGDGMFYSASIDNGKILWSVPVRAEVIAAPSIDNGFVFLETGADVVIALDALTGKQIWTYNRQVTSSLSIRASTQPVVDGEMIYVGFSDGFLVALKKRDGGVLWERKLSKTNRFKDIDATPVIDGANLLVSSFDGSFYSLKKDSGEVNWQIDYGSYTPPLKVGEKLYVSSVSGTIAKVDKANGKIDWSMKVGRGIATSPQFYKGYIVYGESEGSLVVAEAESGKVIGEYSPGYGILSSPTIDSKTDEIFFISSSANLYSLKVRWHKKSELLPWQMN